MSLLEGQKGDRTQYVDGRIESINASRIAQGGGRMTPRTEESFKETLNETFDTASIGFEILSGLGFMMDLTSKAAGAFAAGEDYNANIEARMSERVAAKKAYDLGETIEIAAAFASLGGTIKTVGKLGVKGALSAAQKVGAKLSTKAKVSVKPGVGSVEVEAANKGVYDARKWDAHLQDTYQETVTNHTVLRPGERGAKHAGSTHPSTGVHVTDRGFPDFGDAVMTEARLLDRAHIDMVPKFHMKESTRQIRTAMNEGKITDVHLQEWARKVYQMEGTVATSQDISTAVNKMKEHIQQGRDKIWKFTWHHHEDVGRLQLVPRSLHEKLGHVGVAKWRSPKPIEGSK